MDSTMNIINYINYFLHEMISRYIFFADKVEIQDITKQTSLFVLVGPKSSQVRDIITPF
jgi:hypothetical protein